MDIEKGQEENSALDTNNQSVEIVSKGLSAENAELTDVESFDTALPSAELSALNGEAAAFDDNLEAAENFPAHPRSCPISGTASAAPKKGKTSKKKKSVTKEKSETEATDIALIELENIEISNPNTEAVAPIIQADCGEAQAESISSELEIFDAAPIPVAVEESPITSFLRESAEAEAVAKQPAEIIAAPLAANECITANDAENKLSGKGAEEKSAKRKSESAALAASVSVDDPYQKKLRKKYKLERDELFGNNAIVDGFVLANSEKLLRSYQCLSTANGSGIITVTNKRVLFDAGERTEVPVENIVGIKYARYSHFSFAKFLFSLILIGGGVFVALFLERFIGGMSWYKGWLKYASYGVGAVMLLCSIPLLKWVNKSFYLRFYALQNEAFVSYKGAGKKKDLGENETSIIAAAGKECSKAAREIGALILDIKAGRYND